jgi:MFS family permease
MGGFIQQQAGYPPLFLFSFGVGLLGFFCASQVKEPPILAHSEIESTQSQTDEVSVKPQTEQFWQLLLSPRLRIPALVLLLTGLIFGAIATFVALYIREAKVDLNPGWFYTAAAVSSFSVRLITGRASDRYGRGLFITSSLIFYSLSMLLLSHAQSSISFLLAGFLQGAASGTLLPMMIALISDRSYSHERGRVFSLGIAGFDLGIAIAGPVFGTFAEQLGYQGIFALTTGLALLALIIFMTQNSKNLSHSLRFAIGREQDVYALNKKNTGVQENPEQDKGDRS